MDIIIVIDSKQMIYSSTTDSPTIKRVIDWHERETGFDLMPYTLITSITSDGFVVAADLPHVVYITK